MLTGKVQILWKFWSTKASIQSIAVGTNQRTCKFEHRLELQIGEWEQKKGL